MFYVRKVTTYSTCRPCKACGNLQINDVKLLHLIGFKWKCN